ncbi:MAG: hypothetical protein GY710_26395 [Desulfobacteraceae bacterium]|nr:hypothetical protein [Desulfobacteraceae bacterium]
MAQKIVFVIDIGFALGFRYQSVFRIDEAGDLVVIVVIGREVAVDIVFEGLFFKRQTVPVFLEKAFLG